MFPILPSSQVLKIPKFLDFNFVLIQTNKMAFLTSLLGPHLRQLGQLDGPLLGGLVDLHPAGLHGGVEGVLVAVQGHAVRTRLKHTAMARRQREESQYVARRVTDDSSDNSECSDSCDIRYSRFGTCTKKHTTTA